MLRLTRCIGLVSLFVWPAVLAGQVAVDSAPSDEVGGALWALRRGVITRSVDVLRRAKPSTPSDVVGRLADSLFAIASEERADPLSRVLAVAALGESAQSSNQPLARRLSGSRFDGAFEMLERLARVGYVDAAAMTSISTIDDRAWAARVLESIASDSAYRAVTAIEMLERTMGAEGQSALKRLHSRRLVRYPAAAKELARIAAEKGWAQARPAGAAPPDGVPDALRSIRLGGTDPAVQLLRQNESASQRAGANRLADSLFAIAVDSLTHRSSPSIRRAAVSALSSAARSDLPGAPFQRGPTLLLRLARVRDVEVVAMLGIARLADKRGAAGMLEAVATDNDSRATLAIDYLGRYLGDEGDRALRRLHFGRAVVFPDAARQLDRKASERRWASPSP